MPERRRGKLRFVIILLLIVGLPLVIFVSVGGILASVFLGAKNVEEYECAMSELRKNKEAVEILGDNITDGYFVAPNIEISGQKREVAFTVSVSGSKGSGNLVVSSERSPSRSDFTMMLGSNDGGKMLYNGSYPCK
jgi:hypothetical protein